MSDSRPRVVLALTPPAERAVEELLFGPESPIVPVESIAEADELERLLDSGHAAVLLSPELAGLSAGHAARARAAGFRVVGVALDEHDERALVALGADAIIESTCSPEDFRAAVAGDDFDGSSDVRAEEQMLEGERRRGVGAVVAVVGSKGAPGASECAASLAALASGRWPTVLVEVDALGGALALRLGAEAAEGSMLAVARALAAGEQGLGELVERWVCRREGWPAALPYGDAAEAGTMLTRPGAVRHALEALTRISPLCFVDVGFLLAEADELGPCCRIHREALVSADAVVLVVGAREPQLEAGLAQLDLLLGPLSLPRERLRIVVNGLGGPGTTPRRDLEQALLDRLAARELTADAWLPWDGRALRRAEAAALPLAIARPRGPLARELMRFLDELFLPTTPAARERKRKLPQPAQRDDEEVPLPWRS
jgi:Flp pilus assembly CpaE family ATPase